MVARVTLTGLVEPWILERMSRMPAASSTARTEPPAMTPVPWRGGLEHDPLAENWTFDLVGDRRADHRDLDQVLLGVLDALADRLGDLAGLAEPDSDVPGAVTDDDDRAEAEAPAALDDLGDAVDLDDALLERELVWVDACHGGSFRSELEAGFAGGIGERLDPPVVPEPGSIEDHALEPAALARSATSWPTTAASSDLVELGAAELLLDGRGGGERPSGRVVDDLRVDVVEAAEHRETRPRRPSPPGGGGCGRGACVARRRGWRPASSCSFLRQFIAWLLLAADLAGLAGLAADRTRRRSARPCPCTARACGSTGPSRRSGRRAPCRSRRPRGGSGSRPRR